MAYDREINSEFSAILRVEDQYHIGVDWAKRSRIQNDCEQM